MNNFLKNVFSFILTLLVTSNSFSQKVWTLEDCIAYARENNISVKRALLNEELSNQIHEQSKFDLLPSINANTGYYFNFGKTIDPTTNLFVNQNTQTNTFSLDGSVAIFNGFRKWNYIKQSEYDQLAAKANSDNTLNTVLLYAAGGFLDVVYSQENLKNAEDQLALSQEQLVRTRQLVNSGALTQSALYDMEAQAARDELAKVNAKNTLDLARLNLGQLLDVKEPIEISVPQINMPNQLDNINQTMNDIYDIALTTQPSVFAAQYQLLSAEKGVSLARGSLYPTLSLFASLSTNYSNLYKNYPIDSNNLVSYPIGFLSTDNTPVLSFPQPSYLDPVDVKYSQQFKDNFGQAFGFSLNIPIFNSLQARTAISQSKIRVLDAQLNLDAVKQQLFKDVQSAYADAVAAKNSYEASLKAVTSLQKSFDDAKRKFDLGAINSLDYTTSKNNFTRAQSEVLQSKYQYIFKLKVLDFYQGKPITLQ